MLRNEEHILIIHSVKGTEESLIRDTENTVTTYRRSACIVAPVITKPVVFSVPTGSSSGSTLAGELAEELRNSVGAIVFLDDLRPNVAYELGFFHGQGKTVLLVTTKPIEQVWKDISDLAGCPLLDLNRVDLARSIHAYLDRVYDRLGAIRIYPAPELPTASHNMLRTIVHGARIPVSLYQSDFGDAIGVDTWGGIAFDLNFNLLVDARFKIVLRAVSPASTYSIYFRIRYADFSGNRRVVALGLNSNQWRTGFESNERNLPAQALTQNWRLLTGTFSKLLLDGGIYGAERVEYLELMRVRAGEYHDDPYEKVPAYEIGYFEIVGLDH